MPILPQKLRAQLHSAQPWHRWLGIPLCLLLFLSALSGIILNHRDLLSRINVPRALLPGSYDYVRWSAGLGRGVLTKDTIHYIYGQDGVWVAQSLGDSSHRAISFNEGLPLGADQRKVLAMACDRMQRIWLATPQALYTHDGIRWQECPITSRLSGRLTDLQIEEDTLVVMSRSHVYTTHLGEGKALHWQRHELKTPDDYTGELLLFRLVWALHSGEYLGRIGQTLVDLVGVVTILLSLTGIAYTILRLRLGKRSNNKSATRAQTARALTRQYRWHHKLGHWLIWPIAFVFVSGWLLRPPMMIPLVLGKLKPWTVSALSSNNPWHERLRGLRYDASAERWVLSTSEGFYTLSSWADKPERWALQPPVSPMGANIFEWLPDRETWLIGSFSGLYLANPKSGMVQDYRTGSPPEGSGMRRPISDMLISGLAGWQSGKLLVFSYDRGVLALSTDTSANQPIELAADFVSQPSEANHLPYSLWQYALEVHTGRIYRPLLGSVGVDLFTFFFGLTSIILVLTGYRKRRR